MRTTPKQRIAYHEAGHAVVAVHFSLPIDHVSIVEDGDTVGMTVAEHAARHLAEFRSDPMRIERAWRRMVILGLAGVEAVRLIAPRRACEGSDMDLAHVGHALGVLADGDPGEIDAWHDLLTVQTRNLVEHYRPAVEALAAVLLERQTLAGKQVRQVVRAAMSGT